MPKPSEQFQSLAREFDSLAERLNQFPRSEERTRLLQRMKTIIDQLDGLVWNATFEKDAPSPKPPPERED